MVNRLLTWTSSVLSISSVALIEAAFAVSLAALVARDASPDVLPRLMGSFLVGTALVAVIAGLRSSLPSTVATVQDTPAVVLAAVVAPLVVAVDVADQAPTVLVFVGLAGVVTGVVALLFGLFGLGHVVRFLPMPVLAGFRLGTGWLLIVGGLEIASGRPLSIDGLSGVVLWSSVLAIAVAIALAASERIDGASSYLGVAIAVVGGGFVAIAAAATSVDDVVADGWLLGPSGSAPQWRPVLVELGDVDWGALAGQAPALLAVAFISVTGLLLNTSSLEVELDLDAEVDADLRVTGAANLISGVAGCGPAYVMFSGSKLAHQLGLRSRRSGAYVGIGILALFVIGASVIEYTPRFLAGGLLAGLGVQLLVDWLRILHRETIADSALSLFVAVIIGWVGVLEGVGVGVLVAAAVFVRRYSQIDPVRRISNGTSTFSRVDRSPVALQRLRELAPTVIVVELEGFLFFGSAARVGRTLAEVVDDETRHVLLDFAAVTGLDTSAHSRLNHMVERLGSTDVEIWLASAPPQIGAGMAHHVDDLERGVADVEAALLGDANALTRPSVDPIVEMLAVAPTRTLAADEELFAPGAAADSFVLVESGRISIWLERPDAKPVRVRQVGAGALVGELGFVTAAPRSARAVADEPTTVRVVDSGFVVGQGSEFSAELNRLLLAQIAARLTTTNDLVRSLSR